MVIAFALLTSLRLVHLILLSIYNSCISVKFIGELLIKGVKTVKYMLHIDIDTSKNSAFFEVSIYIP